MFTELLHRRSAGRPQFSQVSDATCKKNVNLQNGSAFLKSERTVMCVCVSRFIESVPFREPNLL